MQNIKCIDDATLSVIEARECNEQIKHYDMG